MIKNFLNKIKFQFEEILKIKTSPFEIAFGFAVGTFFATFPTFGLEFFVLFLLVVVYKKISKITLALAYLVWNPVITYPLAVIGYNLGNKILGSAPIITVELTVFQNAVRFTLRYILGNFIIASILAITSFIIVYYATKKYQFLNQ